MKQKKWIALILAAALCVAALAGCGTGAASSETPATSGTSAADETTETKPVILMVSFGTSYNDSRDKTIGAVENAVADAFPDYEVRRAFTSQTIIDILKERDGLEIDNIEQAFDRLVADGVKTLIVQPTHVMSGYEYDDMVAAVDSYKDKFDSIAVGDPLLTSDEDYDKVIAALTKETAEYNQDGTAIVFMGHGTEHSANAAYAKLQEKFLEANADNYLVGTVEATPSLDDVLAKAKEGNYTKVVLEPLMVVAGDHANNDMAGDEDDSWKSTFKAAGFEVEIALKGLGEIQDIQQIYVEHVQAAIDTLK